MTASPPNVSEYNEQVWALVKQIPEGQVSTYGQIASMIPAPDGVDPADYVRLAPRWVGDAMNITPPGQNIPWQRVIGGKGTISLPEGSRRAVNQRELLEQESIAFDDKGRVDFERYAWDGPAADWLSEHGLNPPKSLKKPPSQPPPEQPKLF